MASLWRELACLHISAGPSKGNDAAVAFGPASGR